MATPQLPSVNKAGLGELLLAFVLFYWPLSSTG